MNINNLDKFIKNILDEMNKFNISETFFEKIEDINYVKYQNLILLHIKKFIDKKINKNEILDIIKNDNYYDYIIDLIKRYIAFYIYLGIGFNYKENRDLYIINLIESSKYQKDASYQLENFYNSENNSKIIKFYDIIKKILGLQEFKLFDKIKLILANNILKYENVIYFFNEINDEDYIINNLLSQNNFHNLIFTLIYKEIYLKEDKIDLIKIINDNLNLNIEYKYIEIVVVNENKIIDFYYIQKFVNMQKLNPKLSEEIYEYLEEMKVYDNYIANEENNFINYLFNNKIIIPITEDFLRYHKDTEKYVDNISGNEEIKNRYDTKIKYIINKIYNIKNLYSSILDNNPKLKLEVINMFYKMIDPRMAVLYNNNEEIKIISKLENAKNISDYELYIDLINIRKYAYINFKDFKNNGLKIKPNKTIQCVRDINLKYKNNNDNFLDLRISNENIDINVIGIIWNPSKISLNNIKTSKLHNVKKKENENGFILFNNKMIDTFEKKNNLYYWIFNNKTDKPILNNYINYNDNIENNINILLQELYNNYIILISNKLNNNIKNITNINTNTIFRFFKKYSKYFNFDLVPNIKNNIILKILVNNIKEIDIIEDEVDSLLPGKRDNIIKLPIVKIEKENINFIKLNFNNFEINLQNIKDNFAICNHHIKWKNILSMSKNTDNFNQAVFNFVKQYIKVNKLDKYICKSCNEIVPIQKYVFEGTYVEELDIFLTTSMAVNQNLEEISKYSKYTKIIKNIDKNIEKMSSVINVPNFIGNTSVIKLKRRMIIKDVIDLLLVHNDWLKNQPKNRIEESSKKYGINKDLTNLFFFELKDEIFLTSSADTDYYKIIKYNNIIAYLLLIYLSEFNSGMIINLKEDKQYNFYLFNKINDTFFNNLFLRKNQKEKISYNKLPLLSYIIYYLSGQVITHKIWLYNSSDINNKNKLLFNINLQKTVIHTLIDLINSIIEANLESNSNFFYVMFTTKLNIKINTIFSDDNIIKQLEKKNNENIIYDKDTNKISIKKKNIEYINLDYDFNNNFYDIPKYFNVMTVKQPSKIKNYINNNFTILTNCDDGKFHEWIFKDNDLYCSLCNKSYNNLIKFFNNKNNNNILEKLKFVNLNKLSLKYCISGNVHDIENNKCKICKINLTDYKPSTKDLLNLESNLNNNSNEIALIHINNMINYSKSMLNTEHKINKIIKKFKKQYINDIKKSTNKDNISNNFINYIDKFINRLIDIIGPKIKINNKTIYLKETIYIIDHDQYGNYIKNEIIILSSDNKINIINHKFFNKKILYYYDKLNKSYVYYDYISLQYLGYSEDNIKIIKTGKNVFIKIELSIKDNILLLGYQNINYNIKYADLNFDINNYINDTNDTDINKLNNDKINDIINIIIRNRIKNLKHLIIRCQSIIQNIKNKIKITSQYDIKEKEIINDNISKFKTIITSDSKNKIFKYHDYILNNLFIKKIKNFNKNDIIYNYIDINLINKLNNTDIKLIYYLIYNFNLLLDLNNFKNIDTKSQDSKVPIKTEIVILIITIINYLFNIYYIPYSNYNIRKFDYLLLNQIDNDDIIKGSGYYQELLSKNEIDDPNVADELYDAKETFDALDIDDYNDENDPDNDQMAEVLHGYDD